MKFNYQSRTKTGEVQTGIVEASNREAAFKVLKTHGLYVTVLEEVATPIYASKIKFFERISSRDIVVFSRQLAIMFKSKVPFTEIFQTLAQQTKNVSFKEKILRLSEEVEGGTSLSNALALYPKLFSPFYVSMVKSGEASGKLTEVFLYLASYLEDDYQFKSKIRGAMIYPIFIVIVFIAVLYLIVGFVIPSLSEFLKETGGDLPWITKMVMAAADFLRTKGWILFLLAIALIASAYYVIKRTPQGRKVYTETIMKIPFLNSFLKKLYLTRFAMNLTTLISGGIPIVQALEITGEVVGNETYKKIIFKTRDEVKKGEKMSAVLRDYPNYISPIFYQMVVVGEKTGTLDSTLVNVVDFYQKEIDREIEGFIKLLEPIIIIFFGFIVMGLVAAVLMPLYSSIGNF
jgi:type II secretory pathway component PulF